MGPKSTASRTGPDCVILWSDHNRTSFSYVIISGLIVTTRPLHDNKNGKNQSSSSQSWINLFIDGAENQEIKQKEDFDLHLCRCACMCSFLVTQQDLQNRSLPQEILNSYALMSSEKSTSHPAFIEVAGWRLLGHPSNLPPFNGDKNDKLL